MIAKRNSIELEDANHFSKRILKIYGNFHLNFTDERNGNWRTKLLDITI